MKNVASLSSFCSTRIFSLGIVLIRDSIAANIERRSRRGGRGERFPWKSSPGERDRPRKSHHQNDATRYPFYVPSRGTRYTRAFESFLTRICGAGLTTTLLALGGTPRPGSSGIAWAIRRARSNHRRSAPRSIDRAAPRNRVRELDLPQSRRSYRTPNRPPSNIITSPLTAPDRFLFAARQRMGKTYRGPQINRRG